jgi:dihydrodipicolinate synthase/N-acetylneuraminate lyase
MPSNESGIAAQTVTMNKPALGGIHVPSLTFFSTSSKQEIDWDTQNKHLRFLIASGVHGIVLAGTNGEAITLSRTEKSELVRATREAARDLGATNLPISLGTSGTSTRDVLDDCTAAKEAGADFALVLVPSFFHFAMTKDAICEFFEEVADASPVPVVIYNFPGVAAGLNVDSTMLDRLAKHTNIVGVKASPNLYIFYARRNTDNKTAYVRRHSQDYKTLRDIFDFTILRTRRPERLVDPCTFGRRHWLYHWCWQPLSSLLRQDLRSIPSW